MKIFTYLFITGIISLLCGGIWIIYRRKMHYWIFSYLLSLLSKKEKPDPSKPVDIILCIANHFEPGYGEVNEEREIKRVNTWLEKYPLLASRHRDYDGKPPRHTFFFPPHYNRLGNLEKILKLCKEGFGEIEVHIHHNRIPPYPDTSESFIGKIKKILEEYSKLGIFGRDREGNIKYGFVHGDWALDNSRGEKFCGINDELTILKETGCYADFTFPALFESQPVMINRIFYAKDDPLRPKSYNRGEEVEVGKEKRGDIMIIQGPLGLMLKKRGRFWKPSIEWGDLSNSDPPTPERIKYWIRRGIHVKGCPNWVIIKLHTHGAWEGCWEAVLGKTADRMFHYLEENYNDGKRYRLHYVTARELYNIIKAAEKGEKGNPGDYRDYLLSPPSYEKG